MSTLHYNGRPSAFAKCQMDKISIRTRKGKRKKREEKLKYRH